MLNYFKTNVMKPGLISLVFFTITAMSRLATAQDIEASANAFLSVLDGNLKTKAQYTFNSNERFDWHYIPKSRNGVSFRDLTTVQQNAAFTLLKNSLSDQGYKKALAIIELEKILSVIEGGGEDDRYRDHLNYYVTIFGTPAKNKVWGWRIEGHHLSINFSSQKGELISATPTFWGSNPATVPSGNEKGKKILKLETELGFSLVRSLTADQLNTALISKTAPSEIVTGHERKARLLQPIGILYKDLSPAQQKVFVQLLDVYIKNYVFGFSEKFMNKIEKAGLNNLSFAWAGSLNPSAGYYYRIQGPVVLIELDNTQNNANHIHSVVRDITDDFAADILREHYEKEH
jgi:hypothetical protein